MQSDDKSVKHVLSTFMAELFLRINWDVHTTSPFLSTKKTKPCYGKIQDYHSKEIGRNTTYMSQLKYKSLRKL